jgi:hypothetical protein
VIRFVLFLLVVVFVAWCSTSVNLGDHTFAGHVKRIWQSDETQDLKEGIKKKAHEASESKPAQRAKDVAKDAAKNVVDEAAKPEPAEAPAR